MTAGTDHRLHSISRRRFLVLLGLALGLVVVIGTLGLLQAQSLAAPPREPGGRGLAELPYYRAASPAEDEDPGTGGASPVLPPWFDLRLGATADAVWPDPWTHLVTDAIEGFVCLEHRNVLTTYYETDSEYLYLRMETISDAGWPGTGNDSGEEARYEWWFDTALGDVYIHGGKVYSAEYKMMLEDLTDNPTNTMSGPPVQWPRDALGELTFIDDLDNVGFRGRWDEKPRYLDNTPDEGNPGAPSPYWVRVYGSGTPGLGGPQEVMSDDIGYQIVSNTVDMYVSWAALGNPTSLCVVWGTDIHNRHLDQLPACDRPAISTCLDIPLPFTTLEIVKRTVPPGEDQDFQFTSTFTDPFTLNAVRPYSDSITVIRVATGTHTITEAVPDGWQLESIVCEDPTGSASTNLLSGTVTFRVDEEDHIKCTFTNTLPVATLTLSKTVVNMGVGEAVASDFQAHIDGTVVNWFDANTVMSGTHQVSETMVSSYYASAWGGDCEADGTITVTAGESYTCTVTNTVETGELAVMKVLVPPDDPGLFDLEIDGEVELGDASHYSSTGWVLVVSGTHTVGESAGTDTSLDDYGSLIECRDDFGTGPVVFSTTTAGPLDVTVVGGDGISCTITNTRKGQLEVVKVLVPDDDDGLFNLRIDGSTERANASDGDSTGQVSVVSGTHSVGETEGSGTSLDHYDTLIQCTREDDGGGVIFAGSGPGPFDLSVADLDIILCTITNTRKVYTVTLVKELDPTDDDGSFDLGINGVTVKSGAKDGDWGQASNVPVGSLVVVSETLASGTDLSEYTITLSCDVATPSGLNPGEFEMPDSDVTCTYSNTRKPPKMLIDKDVVTQPPVVMRGGQVRYLIMLVNNGAGTAHQARIWDILPTGFTYATTVDLSLLYEASRSLFADPTSGDTTPVWGEFTIPPGGRVDIEFIADVADTVGPGTYDNTAYAGGINFEEIDDDGLVGQDPATPPNEDPEEDEDVTVVCPAVGGSTTALTLTPLAALWLGLAAVAALGATLAFARRRIG